MSKYVVLLSAMVFRNVVNISIVKKAMGAMISASLNIERQIKR